MTITVGLAGITGRFGRLLAANLLKNPDVALRGYARDPSKVVSSISALPRTQLFAGGALDGAAIQPFVSGCDVVICAYLGDDKLMVEGQKKLIDACEAARVPRYIASDWSLDYTRLQLGDLFPKDPMKHVKAYLETKEAVKGVHILVGVFMEVILGPMSGTLDPKTNTFRYWGEGTELVEGTTYADAAKYTAKVAVDPSAVGIQKFLGDRKSIKDIAASFEKVYGVKPNLERLGSLDDLKKRMHDLRAESPAAIYSYMFLFYIYYLLNGSTLIGPGVDNGKYPEIKPETWEDFMRNRKLETLLGSMAALSQ
ncbi:hypothetical protein B0T26DRAFT_658561 [Lasiosphaeria miniovina]|uniref:NAD(P)-binding domain-containing protein n=1 Tax=Lasiosphaeria miniovina TaxID=1954250 RepID=A0AA40DLB3_9PEZI|nr:uncharacterized protein B0T26DRAFT_658561 [Lasiosphaeria miniovina]KAK0704043.1 hypothetical protein B0T26DRAFT_658561 [Lasiosphaeria miniovina]